MLGKFFGKKKKSSGYYLELSEEELLADSSKASEKPAAEAPKEEKTKPAKTPVAAAATNGAAATAAPAAPKQPQAAAPVPVLPATISKASAAMPQEVAVPEPVSDPLELIRTALAASANQTEAATKAESESNFATDYLVPKATARRRRPGPSLSPFKAIAKDMKKTSAGF